MNEIQNHEQVVSRKPDSEALSKQSEDLSQNLRDSWVELYDEHILGLVEQRLSFLTASEKMWNLPSVSLYDRLASQVGLVQKSFGNSGNSSFEIAKVFSRKTLEAFNTLAQSQPESIKRSLREEHIQPEKEDSKAEGRAKAGKRLKKQLWISPKSKVPFRKMATFHLEYNGTNRLRAVLTKLAATEQTFGEAWIKTILKLISQPEEDSKASFDALRTLVQNQSAYLQNYLSESARFVGAELQRDTLKIGVSSVLDQHRQKVALISDVKSALENEIDDLEHSSTLQKTLLSLQLAKLNAGIKMELNNLEIMANEQIYSIALQQLNAAEHWLSQLKKQPSSDIEKVELVQQFAFDELRLNESLQRIQQFSTAMPTRIQMTSADDEPVTIEASYLCDYIVDESIQLPLQGILFELPSRYASALSSLAANVSLVEFAMASKAQTVNQAEMLKNALEKFEQQFIRAKEELTEINDKFNNRLDELYANAANRLQSDSLISEAVSHSNASLRKQGMSAVSGIADKLSKPLRKYGEKYRRLLSATKDDIVYSEFRSLNTANESIHARLRTFMESISPNSHALEELPFYYQQLFIGKHAPKENLFHQRHREMKLATEALDRLEAQSGGAIVVLGDPLSGRSFFCDMLCLTLEGKSVYRIEAPLSGSSSPTQLFKAIGHQLQLKDAGAKVLDKAPVGSVFLFNDLELWWERHAKGCEALLALKKLIANYSHKHVFILNTTSYAYRLMRLQLELGDEVISSIPLSPFTQRAMDKAIKQRHSTGGLSFTLDGKAEQLISTRDWRALAEDLNDLSDGNVGASFHLWLGLMTACDGEVMTLRSPKHREFPAMRDRDQLIVLAQMVLHRHMSAKKLSRVLGCETQEAADHLQKLKMSGLIVEVMGGSFRIIPYALPFIVRHLKELQLI